MTYLIAFLGALLAGGINTLSGNGSAITLTILMELLGLPADVANGTNRVGVLANSAGAGYAFNKAGRFEQSPEMNRQMWRIIGIASLGAIVGIYLSLIISNAAYKQIFRYLLVVMLVVILIKPKRWLVVPENQQPLSVWLTVPLFIVVLVYTIIAVAIFAWRDLIDWRFGCLMAAGQLLGGYFTARFAAAHPKAGLYTYRLLIVVIIGAILKAFWPQLSGMFLP